MAFCLARALRAVEGWEACVGTVMLRLTVRPTTGTIRTTGATAEEGGEVRDSNGILGG